jgi:hypothetical protein
LGITVRFTAVRMSIYDPLRSSCAIPGKNWSQFLAIRLLCIETGYWQF